MTTKLRANEFKLIEKHLKKYMNYKLGIENLRKQLDHLYPKTTASYDLAKEGSSGTFLFNSNTENYGIKRAELSKALQDEIESYEVIIQSIDRTMDLLTDREKEYVKLRYFERLENRDVADRMKCSLKMMYNVRDSFKENAQISLRNLLLLEK
ncbi:hypothetical protein ACWA2C_28045 [Priestia megaterium]